MMMLHTDIQQEKWTAASEIFKAMAHPQRVGILFILKDGGAFTVTQIHEKVGIRQTAASHHLNILKEKGVLCSKREGKHTYYFLKHGVLSKIIDCVSTCTCND
jgi:DNA-binding transcriptional ArsR family regulator